jgi:hypothetical protein
MTDLVKNAQRGRLCSTTDLVTTHSRGRLCHMNDLTRLDAGFSHFGVATLCRCLSAGDWVWDWDCVAQGWPKRDPSVTQGRPKRRIEKVVCLQQEFRKGRVGHKGVGFADLDRSTPGYTGPLRLRSGLWPSAIGKER